MLPDAQSTKYPWTRDWLLLLILLVGAVLRFYNYASWSLSNDELSAIVRALGNSPRAWIGSGDSLDMHPIGVQVFLFLWMKLFGQAAAVVRLPFVLLGIGSIYLAFRIANRWFGRLTGLFTAATIAVSGYFILYSQLARPYSPGLFFALLTVYYWTQLLFDQAEQKKTWRNHIGFLIGMLFCMYTHYFSFLFVSIVGITGLFFVKKQNRLLYFVTGVLALVLYLPHLQFTLEQFGAEGLDWLPKPNPETWQDYILNGFNNSDFFLFPILTIFFASLLFFYSRWRFTKFHLLAIVWFALPFCIAYFYSLYKKPVLQFSVLIFSFPYLIFLLFAYLPATLDELGSNLRKGFPLIIGILMSTGAYSLIIDSRFYSTAHFGVFKELAETTKSWDEKYGADKITSTININHPGYIEYYLQKLNHQHRFEQYSCNSTEDLGRLAKVLDEAKTPYFMHAWSTVPNLAETDPIIRTRYPYIIDSKNYFNSAITLYSKLPTDAVKQQKSLFDLLHTFDDANAWENDSITRTTSKVHSAPYASYLDSLHEYGPTYVNRLNKMKPDLDSLDLVVSAWVMSPEPNPGAELVISFESLKNVYDWHSSKVNYFMDKPGQWSQVVVATHIPHLPSNEDLVKVYLWNAQKKQIYVDDIRIEVRKSHF